MTPPAGPAEPAGPAGPASGAGTGAVAGTGAGAGTGAVAGAGAGAGTGAGAVAGAVGPGRVRRFYTVGLCDAVGLGMYLALSALFLDRAAGLTNGQIGLVLATSGAASLLGAMPIARAAERFGIRATLTLLFLTRCAAFLALSAVATFGQALAAAALAGLLSRGIGPLIESGLIHQAEDAAAVGALARLRTLRNAGMALGALPAGAALTAGEPFAYRAVLIASAALFLSCAAICRGFPTTTAPATASAAGRARILGNPPFLAVTALYGALTLSALLLGIGVPLWIVQHTQAPAWTVTLIQLLNTVIVVALQMRLSRGSERLGRARALMACGGLAAAAGALAVPLTAAGGARLDVAVLVAAALLLSLGEVLITAGTMGAALAHIPPGRQTSHLAAFNLGFAVTTVIGPPLIGAGVGWGAAGWAAWAALFAALGLAALRVPAPAAPMRRRAPRARAAV